MCIYIHFCGKTRIATDAYYFSIFGVAVRNTISEQYHVGCVSVQGQSYKCTHDKDCVVDIV